MSKGDFESWPSYPHDLVNSLDLSGSGRAAGSSQCFPPLMLAFRASLVCFLLVFDSHSDAALHPGQSFLLRCRHRVAFPPAVPNLQMPLACAILASPPPRSGGALRRGRVGW
eukprot:768536-Hanusia_phi.AAC.4